MLKTPEKIRELQIKLYRKAKQEKEYRCYLLYDKIYKRDILTHAYRLVKANKGSPGIDGETFERIEEREGGAEKYLEEIAGELQRKAISLRRSAGFTFLRQAEAKDRWAYR